MKLIKEIKNRLQKTQLKKLEQRSKATLKTSEILNANSVCKDEDLFLFI